MATPKSKSEAAAETAFDSVTKLEVPAAMRDFAEKGVAQAKDAYAKFKVIADETSDTVEVAYTNASKGASAFGQKMLESTRSNINAALDHMIALSNVRNLSDAIELQTAFVRKQTEALAGQAREFGELAQKVSAEAASPIRSQFEKSLKFPG